MACEGVLDDGVGGPMGESAGLLSAEMGVPAARCFLTILASAFCTLQRLSWNSWRRACRPRGGLQGCLHESQL